MTQHPDNVNRGNRAMAALKLYQELIGEYDMTNVRDLLTDLRHYCETHDIDYLYEDRVADGNYIEEVYDPTGFNPTT